MKYRVKEEFNTLCCIFPMKPGDEFEIYKENSPKMWLVVRTNDVVGSIHKVKKSTVNRCCEVIESKSR